MKTIGFIFGAIIALSFFAFIMAFPATLLWYTFDDRLAMLVGNESWGNVPWYNVYGFVWFLAFAIKGSSGSNGSK